MSKYVLLVGNGEGITSRRLESEKLYVLETEAETLDKAIDNLEKELRAIDLFDSYDEDEHDSYFEYFKHKRPEDGDIWILGYLEDGKLVERCDLDLIKSGLDGEYEFDNPADAVKFDMPSHIEDNYSMEKFVKHLAKNKKQKEQE